MAYLNLLPSLKNTRSNDILTAIGSNALLKIYTGSPPADPSVAATGTLLVTLSASATFGTVSSAVLTANAITSANAVATGTAGYCRTETSVGGGVVDMDVTATGGGGSVQLNTVSITAGLQVSITSYTITEA